MSEYLKQSEFLKSLLEYDEAPESEVLRVRLTIAERNEYCIYSACRLVGMVGILSLFGLGYSAVLLPSFFDSSSHFLIQLCSALGLGSAMCLALFVGLWLWYRAASNKVRGECRRSISKLIESRFLPEKLRGGAVIHQSPYVSVYRSQPAPAAGSPAAAEVPLRKAS
jgi:hypothetical protein